MQAPAFTVVSARKTFGRGGPSPFSTSQAHPQPPPQPAPLKQQKMTREWPAAVRQYVQRSFAESNTISSVPRSEMEAKLKKVISDAAENNALLTTDWDNLPLPQEMIQREKNQLYTQPVAISNEATISLHLNNANTFSSPASAKKRKSSEFENDLPGQSIPPWRIKNGYNGDHAPQPAHQDKKARKDKWGNGDFQDAASLENRRKRFEKNLNYREPSPPSRHNSTDHVAIGPVVGTSQDLEKRYLRLTAPPKPETVRPLHILKQTLELLKKKWRKDNNYTYICDQFKSLRQDLTVQHIKNDFTVNVYEIHARIALEKGDLGEYNQCQTQLRSLYAQNLGGHPTEFKAYRILYFLHTCNRTDMNDVLADLTPAEKKEPAVKHALDCRSSLALGNYHAFFKLYLDTPNMGAYLVDMFVTRERLAALAILCKAYKPDVRLRFVTEELAFESDEEAARFICDHEGQAFLEERDGEARLITGKSASLFENARRAAFGKVDIKGQI